MRPTRWSSGTRGNSTISRARRPDFVTGRVTNRLSRLPARRPGSVRRMSSLAIEPAGGWDEGLVVEAVAQDSVAGPGDATVSVLAAASVTTAMDAGSRLTAVRGD